MWGRFGVYSRCCNQVEGEPVKSGGALDVVDLTTSIALLSGVDLHILTRLARRARETQFAMYPRFRIHSILLDSVQVVSTPQTFPLPAPHVSAPPFPHSLALPSFDAFRPRLHLITSRSPTSTSTSLPLFTFGTLVKPPVNQQNNHQKNVSQEGESSNPIVRSTLLGYWMLTEDFTAFLFFPISIVRRASIRFAWVNIYRSFRRGGGRGGGEQSLVVRRVAGQGGKMEMICQAERNRNRARRHGQGRARPYSTCPPGSPASPKNRRTT